MKTEIPPPGYKYWTVYSNRKIGYTKVIEATSQMDQVDILRSHEKRIFASRKDAEHYAKSIDEQEQNSGS